MRMIRTVLAALVAVVLTLGLGVALQAPAGAAGGPKRIIEEENPAGNQVGFAAFVLKGSVSNPLSDGSLVPYADGPIKLQKKVCRDCRWKLIKTFRTSDTGTFRTKIYAPRQGRWKWRVKVPASAGYATTLGRAWAVYFR